MILISIVHYNNSKEISQFLRHLDVLPGAVNVEVVITDNSGNLSISTDVDNLKNVFVQPYSINLGYINGAYSGFDFWRQSNISKFDSLKYAIICNSDVVIEDFFISKLIEKNYSENIACVAPNVILENGVRQNPNIIARISRSRLNFLLLIHRISFVGAVYILLSRLKNWLKLGGSRYTPRGQYIYAPHGSFMIFTRVYLAHLFDLKFNSFMQDEELHVAEEIFSRNMKVFFDDELLLTHHHHSTTKYISLIKTSKWHYQSLKSIKRRYFI